MNPIETKDIMLLHRHLEASKKTVCISHINPDGDAVGSTVAMAAYIGAAGKKATVIYPHKVPSSVAFLTDSIGRENVMIHEEEPEKAYAAISDADLVICMDFNSFARTGDGLESALGSSGAVKILIDHHLNPDREAFSLCFSETEVSSTAELLYHILMAMPDISGDAHRLPVLSATACMTGMTTDTNNFANSVYPGTLEMAGSLLKAGTDREMILNHLYSSYKEERIRLMGEMLYRRMKITPDGVAYMILDKETIGRYNIQDGDTEGFVNIPLGIEKVRMSIFLKEEKDKFKVSLRSKKGVSSNRCAIKHFNGGGHELASGGRLMIPSDVKSAEDAAAYIEKATAAFMNGQEI